MSPSPSKQASTAVGATAFLLLTLGAAFYSDFFLPVVSPLLSLLAICFQLYFPIYILDRWRVAPRDYNLYANKVELILDNLLPPYRIKKQWPDINTIKRESSFLIKLSIIAFPLFSLSYIAYFYLYSIVHNQSFVLRPNFGGNLIFEFVVQVLVVALPEEFFFRGFLQSALLKKWPNKFYFAKIPLGRAIIVTNALFALAHFVGGFFPHRLLTFFPGLIFSWLTYRTKGIYSSILFHAACNILGRLLHQCVFV